VVEPGQAEIIPGLTNMTRTIKIASKTVEIWRKAGQPVLLLVVLPLLWPSAVTIVGAASTNTISKVFRVLSSIRVKDAILLSRLPSQRYRVEIRSLGPT
jgi:Na+-transporting methylmalonyl-CoA/oxaloacetate decarboxylase beta subunit